MFGNRSVNGLVRSGTHECVLNSFAIPAVKLLTLFPSSFVNFVLIRWKRRSQMISWTHCAFPSPFCSHCGIQIVYHVFFVDPYVRVVFGNSSTTTEPLEKTLCPTWDQTLIFENLGIHGSVKSVVDNPPNILLEVFDKDKVVSMFPSFCARNDKLTLLPGRNKLVIFNDLSAPVVSVLLHSQTDFNTQTFALCMCWTRKHSFQFTC